MGFLGCLKWGAVLAVLLACAFPLILSEVAAGWTTATRSSFDPAALKGFEGKTALVTGASTGIGRHTAVALGRAGLLVLVHGRSEKSVAPIVQEIKAAGGKATAVIGDFSSLASVAPMATSIKELSGGGTLDIAVLNAGLCKECMGTTDTGFEFTADGFELHIQVNHLAHQLLVEKLQASKALGKGSRVVAVSSALESRSYPEGMRYSVWQTKGGDYTDGFAYGQSKLANVMMAHVLHKRFGIQSVSVHPGIIATDLGRYVEKEELSLGKQIFRSLFKLAQMTAEQGALNQLWAATAPNLESGNFWPVGKEKPSSHPAFSDAASSECWDKTHEALKAFM